MFIVRLIKLAIITTAFLAAFFPVYINISASALTEEELEQKVQRLEKAMDALAEDPDNPELLYEKGAAMLETLGPFFSLRTATNALLRAIELAPDNKKYKEYLAHVYDSFWKPADYTPSEKDLREMAPVEIENLNQLQAIKDRVKARRGPLSLSGRGQGRGKRIHCHCERKEKNFIFDNNLVKKVCKKHGFGNPFDVTKLDDTAKFPKILLKEDYFILHLGQGKHKFVKGINRGFHCFEKVNKKNIIDWKYRKSILNEFDTSESNILSVAGNQKIINDFLYEDIAANPKIYNARRTKTVLAYRVGKEKIKANNLQMEIDLTMELNSVVTVFEGKNNRPKILQFINYFTPLNITAL